ncbi:hypothetical protein [Brevifollis gellanilyticus]|uniref:hypothetical protein n=1 Tax=Brevifollis gellanilyticus TaxID=748831 RepID=UPI0011BFDB12|nr:hypothetical protein [Brevifollis gellanilyticus]
MNLHMSPGLHPHPACVNCTPEQREVLISALQLYQTKLSEDALESDDGAREEVLLEALVAADLTERLKEFRQHKHDHAHEHEHEHSHGHEHAHPAAMAH